MAFRINSSQQLSLTDITQMLLRDADIYADFEFNEDGSKILRCPMGNVPQSCCQSSSNGHFYVSFPKDVCMNCPHKEECRAKAKRYMKTEESGLLCRIRNGIETVPSVLRRKYRVDRMPVHGTRRNRLFFWLQSGSIQCKKTVRISKRDGTLCPKSTFRRVIGGNMVPIQQTLIHYLLQKRICVKFSRC